MRHSLKILVTSSLISGLISSLGTKVNAQESCEGGIGTGLYYVDSIASQSTNAPEPDPATRATLGSTCNPFKTIQAAADMAKAGETVYILPGIYRETIVPKNSGSPGAPITFSAYGNSSVIVSGTDPVLAPWTPLPSTVGNVYSTQGVDLGPGKNQVFVDGVMLREAQWPATGIPTLTPTYLSRPPSSERGTVEKVSSTLSGSIYSGTLNISVVAKTLGLPSLQYGESWKGAEFHTLVNPRKWEWLSGQISALDSPTRTVAYSMPCKAKVGTGVGCKGNQFSAAGGNGFFISGKLSLLTKPGQFFVSPTTPATLYLKSPGSHNLSDPVEATQHQIEIKKRLFGFDLRDRSHITLKGITLFATGIITSPISSGIELKGLSATYIDHATISRELGVSNAAAGIYPPSGGGIILMGNNHKLLNSKIRYSAESGVYISGDNIVISDNLIRDVNYAAATEAAAVKIVGGKNNLIQNNVLYNSARALISFSGGPHKITRNLMHDPLLQTDDNGAFYTFGLNGKGSEISYNKIYNSRSVGIYLDNGSANYFIHHNLILNTTLALFLNPPFNTSLCEQPVWPYNISCRSSGTKDALPIFHQIYQNTFLANDNGQGISAYSGWGGDYSSQLGVRVINNVLSPSENFTSYAPKSQPVFAHNFIYSRSESVTQSNAGAINYSHDTMKVAETVNNQFATNPSLTSLFRNPATAANHPDFSPAQGSRLVRTGTLFSGTIQVGPYPVEFPTGGMDRTDIGACEVSNSRWMRWSVGTNAFPGGSNSAEPSEYLTYPCGR